MCASEMILPNGCQAEEEKCNPNRALAVNIISLSISGSSSYVSDLKMNYYQLLQVQINGVFCELTPEVMN